MLHKPFAPIVDDHVERIDGARVIVIEPGRENAEATQFPAILVGKDIVWIIRARAEVLEGPDGTTGEKLARNSAVCSVCAARYPRQQSVEVAFTQAGLRIDPKLFTTEKCDVVFWHVVAERVEELRRDDLCSRSHLRVFQRIELHDIHVATGVANAEAGSHTFGLRLDHEPRLFG